MVILGVILHAIGGFAAASFYIPFKKVRNWAWESYWIVGGFSAWVIMPWLIGFITVPMLISILCQAPKSSMAWSYAYGILWGVGGITFGLSMRYLGMSLGYAIALGFCAAFGTVLPPIYNGTFGELLSSNSGLVILTGVAVCLLGIVICGKAGISKEKELLDEEKTKTIKEFNFKKGLLVAIFSGIMSACMAFGLAAGKPLAEFSVDHGVESIWQNTPVFIVIFAGGFTTNLVWCLFLNIKNKSGGDYFKANNASIVSNYFFSTLAGITWYLQFMFYGMGTTKMGKYDFSSWSIHMAFIIVFSNIWGLIFHEWKGCSKRTVNIIISGILVVMLSIILIGVGNYLGSINK